MPQAPNARAKRLRDLADRVDRYACNLQQLADEVERPPRTIARAEQLIAEGERIASELNDCAATSRRVFRG